MNVFCLIISFLVFQQGNSPPNEGGNESIHSPINIYSYRDAKTVHEMYEALDFQLTLSLNSTGGTIPLELVEDAWQFKGELGDYPIRARFFKDHSLFLTAVSTEFLVGTPYIWLERFARADPNPVDMFNLIRIFLNRKGKDSYCQGSYVKNLASIRKYLLACNKGSILLRSSSPSFGEEEWIQSSIIDDLAWFDALRPYGKNAKIAWRSVVNQIIDEVPFCELEVPLPQSKRR